MPAASAGPPSPLVVAKPVPTCVEILPTRTPADMSTQRIRAAEESATHTSVGVQSATPLPRWRVAFTDGPPSPMKAPVVALRVIDTIAPVVALYMRSRRPEAPSVKKMLSFSSSAMPQGA
jgi:hypothetical protein